MYTKYVHSFHFRHCDNVETSVSLFGYIRLTLLKKICFALDVEKKFVCERVIMTIVKRERISNYYEILHETEALAIIDMKLTLN